MKRLMIAMAMAASSVIFGPMVPDRCAKVGAANAAVTQGDARPISMPLPLKVVGTHIVNSRGERVRLRGVNAAGMEWSSNGEGLILETVTVAIRD